MSLYNPPALAVDDDLPVGALAQTGPRLNYPSAITAASGKLYLSRIKLTAGMTVSAIHYHSVGNALASPSNGWAALYDSSFALLAQSPNDTAIAWGVNTDKAFTLSTPKAITVTGWYYIGLMVAAGSMPNASGVIYGGPAGTMSPSIGGGSNAGLTATAPANATAPTFGGTFWGYVT